jgi:hypothetical protein
VNIPCPSSPFIRLLSTVAIFNSCPLLHRGYHLTNIIETLHIPIFVTYVYYLSFHLAAIIVIVTSLVHLPSQDLCDQLNNRFPLYCASALLPAWLRCRLLQSRVFTPWRRWAAGTAQATLEQFFPGGDEDSNQLKAYLCG